MSRTQWETRLTETLRARRTSVPADVHQDIEGMLASLPERGELPRRRSRRRQAGLATAAAGMAAILLLFFAGSSSFAETVKHKLQSIFWASGDPALMQGGIADRETALAEAADKSYALRIHEAMYDGQRLSLSYSVSQPGGIPRSRWVRPDFRLDAATKAAYPGILFTDSGGLQEGVKTGIVNYYFTGKAPERFTLKVAVPGMAVFDDPAQQKVISGDWSFELPIEKTGQTTKELGGLPAAADGDVRFQAKQVRVASNSTLWRLYWEYPSKLLPNALDDDAPRYDVIYDIEADDRKLTAALNEKSGGRLRQAGDYVEGFNYAAATLVTEQLPQGVRDVTITPVLREWSKDAKAGYTEKPLTDFVLRMHVRE